MALRSTPPTSRLPAINLPPLTKASLLVIAGLHIAMMLAPVPVESWIVLHFAFIPAAYSVPGWPIWSLVITPLSYALLHGGIGHLTLNGVMLAVMGQVLERRLGPLAFLALFAIGAAGGAVTHALVTDTPQVPLIGASAGVGALYGVGFVLQRRGLDLGPNADLLVMLAVLFVVFNLIGLVLPILASVAYAAHLGGFFAGVLAAVWLPIPGRRWS
jgi:membrane associated rhomboid family serine protease